MSSSREIDSEKNVSIIRKICFRTVIERLTIRGCCRNKTARETATRPCTTELGGTFGRITVCTHHLLLEAHSFSQSLNSL